MRKTMPKPTEVSIDIDYDLWVKNNPDKIYEELKGTKEKVELYFPDGETEIVMTYGDIIHKDNKKYIHMYTTMEDIVNEEIRKRISN